MLTSLVRGFALCCSVTNATSLTLSECMKKVSLVSLSLSLSFYGAGLWLNEYSWKGLFVYFSFSVYPVKRPLGDAFVLRRGNKIVFHYYYYRPANSARSLAIVSR